MTRAIGGILRESETSKNEDNHDSSVVALIDETFIICSSKEEADHVTRTANSERFAMSTRRARNEGVNRTLSWSQLSRF